MCGIAGFFNLNGAPASAAVLEDMVALQRHRGPDDSGMRMFSLSSRASLEVSGPTHGRDAHHNFEGALGFNRLSIQDLSVHGHQPMCNGDESIFLAFNGEIYNAADYRGELKAAGYTFRSTSDTEVILYLYEHLGFERMLDRLNGMFSICIVDLNRQEILIARDHFGIKPLYWTHTRGTFMFSSEIKSFLRHPSFSPELDPSTIDEYSMFRYCAGDKTLMNGVAQLKPGHFLRITPKDIFENKYWEVPSAQDTAQLSDEDALRTLDRLLGESVERQLISDVSLGSQLSGGVDSSLVTHYARKKGGADLEGFSIVFQDPRYSEQEWITKASAMADVRSHLYEMRVSDMLATFENATWHLDQPLNLPNSLGIYLLAERSKPLVTVLLSGEGADELFGGYSRFYDAALRRKLAPYLPSLGLVPVLGKRLMQKFKASLSPSDAFIMSSAALTLPELSDLRPDLAMNAALANRRELYGEPGSDELGDFQKYDMQTYMVDLLVRQDKMTMAHSMENRVPFLDRQLVEFVRTLRPSQLVGDSILFGRGYSENTKIILKRLAEEKFDHDFAYRKKSGFPLPLEEFFQTSEFREYMEDVVLPGIKARGVFEFATVNNWWREIRSSGKKNGKKVWIAVAFEIWAQKFLDASHGTA